MYAKITRDTYTVLDTMGDAVDPVPTSLWEVIAQDDVTGMVILKDTRDGPEQYLLANHLDLTYYEEKQ